MKQTKPFITAQQHIQGINRKRFFFITMAVLFILITNTAFTAISDEQEPLLVRVGAYANNPKIFMNANGKVAGFWPDLIEDIAKRENWKIEYVWGTWSEELDHLINKEIDIMPDVAFTKKRNKLYAFSEASVLMSWARMYLNKENTEKESIIDLKNKKIAALKGSANLEGIGGLREIALRFNLNCTFLELDTYKEVFKAVEENRADAGITNRNFGNKNAEFFKIKKTPVIFQPITIKFAFPKDAELTSYLVEKINYHIKKFKQDEHSVYYQLLEKHFETEIAEKTIEVFPVWLGTALKGITALFLFFIAVIIVSRIQVKRKTNEIILKNKMLQRSEEQYRAIYNAPSDAIFIHDASTGKIVDVNRAMLDMYGYDYEEAIKLEVAVFSSGKHPYTWKQAGELLNKAVIDGPQTFEWQARKKNGEFFWVEVALKYYKIQDTGYVVAIVRDSTDRKRKALEKANMEYAAANKELKEFAYIVSHDLKAPLRAISQLTQWIAEDYSEAFDDDGKKQMDLILKRVKRMDGLIDGILRYSRVGRIREKKEDLDLNLLVNEVIENIAPPDNIQIIFENKLPVVLGDSIRMAQVFQNLIANSINFMDKDEGIIKVGCVDEGKFWKFSVSDNGPGIDKKYHDKIFQIFQTLRPRDEHESTGIGLTLVKKIIELYNGFLWVESEAGRGAKFYFTLPKKGEKHEKS